MVGAANTKVWVAFDYGDFRPCEACGDDLRKTRSHYSARFCIPCSNKRQRGFVPKIAQSAYKVVAAAVASGHLQPASQRLCVDCLLPAKVYDHRDYRYPLQVEPVCMSCNALRGPANGQ